jgi:thiamine pyrophosphate-dependent acetolactate synthase large subunit-like protein
MEAHYRNNQNGPGHSQGMSCEQALDVLAQNRRPNQIVVANQMSARLWPTISQHPLDFNYYSSTMGGAIPLGLGLALARPDYSVIVLSGDGSLLMSMGTLVTVVASGARNITIVVLDNGLYEVTGGQQTAGRHAEVNYAAAASACGFKLSRSFHHIEPWRACVIDQWPTAGPSLYALRVLPVEASTPRSSATDVANDFKRLRNRLMG